MSDIYLNAQRLEVVRANMDREGLFQHVGLKITKRHEDGRIQAFSPLRKETKPSFWMSKDGKWYDFGSAGGHLLELLQQVENISDIYTTARRAIELGLSSISGTVRHSVAKTTTAQPQQVKENIPTTHRFRENLTYHPAIEARGISEETAKELGFGYFHDPDKPPLPDEKIRKGWTDYNGALLFEVRSLQQKDDGGYSPLLLNHQIRLIDETQIKRHNNTVYRWFGGFHASLEIYNIDLAVLDESARQQIRKTGQIIIVEGCFDTAKLWEAGIRNVVATFTGEITTAQVQKLKIVKELTGASDFLICFDRDRLVPDSSGTSGSSRAVDKLKAAGFGADIFDWDMTLPSPTRGQVPLLKADDSGSLVNDPCEFSVDQLQYLRNAGLL